MDKETLKFILSEGAKRRRPDVRPRALKLPLTSRKIVTLVGIRRCGKTFLIYDTMRRLEAEGVERSQMIYLNFEDDRLLPIKSQDLDLILRAHEELFPEATGRIKYLFFDEVQGVRGWEAFIRRLHDTADAHLFVTGSSSHLLTRELTTALRGRSISFEVFPLSFPEFLEFRGLKHEPYSRASESRMAAALEDYIRTGGLPEVVLAEDILRPRILREYVDLLFYKDLAERYRIANPQVLRLLLKQCLGHPASLLNIHKTYHDYRSQGLDLSKDTLYRYVHHLEESCLIYLLPVAERSLRKQAVNPKKLHPVDWSLASALVADPTEDLGHKLETAVFLHWRRQRDDLAYLGGDREVDVVVGSSGPEELVNVAWSATAGETWDREIAGLARGAERFPRARRLLVLHERPSTIPPPGIEIVDAWKYLSATVL